MIIYVYTYNINNLKTVSYFKKYYKFLSHYKYYNISADLFINITKFIKANPIKTMKQQTSKNNLIWS